jgi:hypothetical protein
MFFLIILHLIFQLYSGPSIRNLSLFRNTILFSETTIPFTVACYSAFYFHGKVYFFLFILYFNITFTTTILARIDSYAVHKLPVHFRFCKKNLS